MKKINNYILEKLYLDRNFKINPLTIGKPQCIEDAIIIAVIVCLKEHCYKKTATGMYKLQNIKYEPMVKLAHELFGYDTSKEDIVFKKGSIWKIVTQNKQWIEALMGGKKISRFYYKNDDLEKSKTLLDGKEIISKYKDYITGTN